MVTRRLAYSLLFVVLSNGSVRGQIVYDDGQQHVLSQDVLERVVVSHQSTLDVQATIDAMVVDNATVVINGGRIRGNRIPFEQAISLQNDANLILNDGHIQCSVDPAWHDVSNSNVIVNGGEVYGGFLASGASTIVVNSGEIQNSPIDHFSAIGAGGTTKVTINGGRVRGTLDSPGVSLGGSATLDITDGRVSDVAARGTSAVKISGGVVGGGVRAIEESVIQISGGEVSCSTNDNGVIRLHDGTPSVTVTGGTFPTRYGCGADPETFYVFGDAILTLYGSAFNWPLFEPIQARSGIITGILQDGSSIDLGFLRSETATIVLVPEPNGVLLLLVGSGVCLWCRRR